MEKSFPGVQFSDIQVGSKEDSLKLGGWESLDMVLANVFFWFSIIA